MQVHSGSSEQQAADKAKVERQLSFMEEWKRQFDQLPEETQAVIFWNPLHPVAENLSRNVDKALQRRGL